jgi:UPF0755 protein
LILVLVACDPGAPAHPDRHEPVVFEVPAGASARGLGPALAQAGLVSSASAWTWFLRLGADGSCVKAGRHQVRPDMRAEEVLAALCGAPIPNDVPFTVVEGWRIREIDAALAAQGWIDAGEFATAAADPAAFHVAFGLPGDSLEGYLFPETYKVDPVGFDPGAFAQRQLDTFAERFWSPHRDELQPRGLQALVTMASLIEREEPTPANRPLVAGILWKRIDAQWNLGVDATSRYGLDDWNDRAAFLKRLRDADDPYNTRLRPGLPPTPIGSPGLDALLAALHPAPSEYWYYLHDADHRLHPAKDVAGHEANRRKYNVY